MASDEYEGPKGQPPSRARELQDEITTELMADLRQQASVDRGVLATLAAEGLIDRTKIAELQAALIASKQIGAATGIIMALRNVDQDAAFELLTGISEQQGQPLQHIADQVVATRSIEH